VKERTFFKKKGEKGEERAIARNCRKPYFVQPEGGKVSKVGEGGVGGGESRGKGPNLPLAKKGKGVGGGKEY